MRSRRSLFESACRIGAFAALGWMLGASVFPSRAVRVERASSANVDAKLGAWTRASYAALYHVDVAAAPSARTSAWLGALRRSGKPVTWSGALVPLAVAAEPSSAPDGGTRVDVAAPSGAAVALRDSASPIDSLRVADLGATVALPLAIGQVQAVVRGETASVAVPPPAKLRSIVLLGGASWEGKFVAAALEESGWRVDARFTVAPRVDVTSAVSMPVLDTGSVAAVVAIDSTIDAYGPSIDRFVRMGGGLVLAGPAASSRAVASLAPGVLGPRTHPNVRPNDTIRLGSTGYYPVSSLRDDGVALERRAAGIAVAARRVGAGRVIELGYDDSWRWRMAGGAGSEAAHRAWWTRVVAAVAYAPGPNASAAIAGGAPVAALARELGPPRALPANAPGGAADPRILSAIIMILLLAEWASRRLRGRR